MSRWPVFQVSVYSLCSNLPTKVFSGRQWLQFVNLSLVLLFFLISLLRIRFVSATAISVSPSKSFLLFSFLHSCRSSLIANLHMSPSVLAPAALSKWRIVYLCTCQMPIPLSLSFFFFSLSLLLPHSLFIPSFLQALFARTRRICTVPLGCNCTRHRSVGAACSMSESCAEKIKRSKPAPPGTGHEAEEKQKVYR